MTCGESEQHCRKSAWTSELVGVPEESPDPILIEHVASQRSAMGWLNAPKRRSVNAVTRNIDTIRSNYRASGCPTSTGNGEVVGISTTKYQIWHHKPSMSLWRKIVRSAALVLLLNAGVDLLLVDALGPALYAETGSARQIARGEAAQSQNPSSSGGAKQFPDDDCFCCCSHIVISHSADVTPADVISFALPSPSSSKPLSEPTCIYHPPRA